MLAHRKRDLLAWWRLGRWSSAHFVELDDQGRTGIRYRRDRSSVTIADADWAELSSLLLPFGGLTPEGEKAFEDLSKYYRPSESESDGRCHFDIREAG